MYRNLLNFKYLLSFDSTVEKLNKKVDVYTELLLLSYYLQSNHKLYGIIIRKMLKFLKNVKIVLGICLMKGKS